MPALSARRPRARSLHECSENCSPLVLLSEPSTDFEYVGVTWNIPLLPAHLSEPHHTLTIYDVEPGSLSQGD